MSSGAPELLDADYAPALYSWGATDAILRQCCAEASSREIRVRLERASSIYRRSARLPRCSTGSRSLDSLLGGGLEPSSVTEFFGEFSTGKSQLSMTASVMCQLREEDGGLDGGAIYIDSEGTFRPERVSEIAEARGLSPRGALERIMYARVSGAEELEAAVKEVPRIIRDHGIKLVVVDSIIAPYRAEFIGREALQERQQRLLRLLHELKETAEEHRLPVIVTNHVVSIPNPFLEERLMAAGGNAVAHSTTHRVMLYRKGERRFARIVDSPSLPPREVEFRIERGGVV